MIELNQYLKVQRKFLQPINNNFYHHQKNTIKNILINK